MQTELMSIIYPGIRNVNERISAEAVARANAMLLAANQISGYIETAYNQLTQVTLENA